VDICYYIYICQVCVERTTCINNRLFFIARGLLLFFFKSGLSSGTQLKKNSNCNSISKSSKIKPYRPCTFCPDHKLFSNLRRHIIRKHPKEIEDITSLSPQKQKAAFLLMRNEGIYQYNKSLYDEGSDVNLMSSRKSEKESKLRMCSQCKGFIGRRNFSKHTRYCSASPSKRPKAIDANAVFSRTIKNQTYKIECINHLKDDEVGDLIKNSPDILYVGEKLFLQTSDSKPTQKRRRTCGFLRRIGIVYKYFLENVSDELKFNEILDAKYIDEMTGSLTQAIREGVTQAPMFSNSIKFCCNRFVSKFHDSNDDSSSLRIERFERSFDHMFKENFKNLVEKKLMEKSKAAKKPSYLPPTNEVNLVVQYCRNVLDTITTIDAAVQNFVSFRRSLCALLTFENSRRGNYLSFIEGHGKVIYFSTAIQMLVLLC